ncbi:MAG TPA: ATP-binding protein, partial [Candidatus Limnocylindria bacterium]|nr:ATP-binding protein [Candidatus Limnocylindria bacterium]
AVAALGGRLVRRLRRLESVVSAVREGRELPYVAAERDDALGRLEAALGGALRVVHGRLHELGVERDRFQTILRGMAEGVLVADLDGRVVLANARAAELLGTPDPVGHLLVELARDPGISELVRAVAAGASASRDVQLGSAARGVSVQVNGARLADAEGRPFGVVLVVHDVTELRRLEVMRRDFVANVSHELRTPLTAIKGYAETLLGPAGDDRETSRRFLAVIDRHAQRLGRLVDDLLTLSDLELGRTPMHLVEMSVGPAVDDVLQIFEDAAERAGVRLLAQVAPDTPPIVADGDRLQQVLINLVDNALKFTPRGGQVMLRVGAVAPPRAGLVEIAVSDTGVGIPAQALPRLTERFFRVDKARSRELGGTGLGLAIVKHIVQAHGGALEIASALGKGTTVSAFFPAAPAAAPADREAVS